MSFDNGHAGVALASSVGDYSGAIDASEQRERYLPRGKKHHDWRARISPEVVGGIVLMMDFLAVVMAAEIAQVMYITEYLGTAHDRVLYEVTEILAAALFVFVLHKLHAYQFQRLWRFWPQLRRVVAGLGITLSLLVMVAFLAKLTAAYSRGWAVTWVGLVITSLVVTRIVLHSLIQHWLRRGFLSRSVAIIGARDLIEMLVDKITETADESQVVIAGVFDDGSTGVRHPISGFNKVGTLDDLIALARRTLVDEVVIALPLSEEKRIGALVARLQSLPIDLSVSTELMGSFPIRGTSEIASVRTIKILERPIKNFNAIFKRLEDITIAAAAIILHLPLMVLIAVAIKLDSEGPVLFSQQRFGFNNRKITVYKFRTMYINAGDFSGAARTTRNDPRVTRVGRLLRRLSLDELPQFVNVLIGDMSVVGPRAHAIAMKAGDKLYHDAVDEYFLRHRVRPGLTGLAQVNGLRGEIDTVEKARERVVYDLSYIDNWSIWLDIKIVVLTIRVLFSRTNAY